MPASFLNVSCSSYHQRWLLFSPQYDHLYSLVANKVATRIESRICKLNSTEPSTSAIQPMQRELHSFIKVLTHSMAHGHRRKQETPNGVTFPKPLQDLIPTLATISASPKSGF